MCQVSLTVPPSQPESCGTRAGHEDERLELVARSTGGVVAPDRAAIWKFDGEPARTPKDTWWWRLVVAAILLPLDIALRRLSS